jgi:hypothetical protein
LQVTNKVVVLGMRGALFYIIEDTLMNKFASFRTSGTISSLLSNLTGLRVQSKPRNVTMTRSNSSKPDYIKCQVELLRSS